MSVPTACWELSFEPKDGTFWKANRPNDQNLINTNNDKTNMNKVHMQSQGELKATDFNSYILIK